MDLREKMIKFSEKPAPNAKIEGWQTRFGYSVRAVKRTENGRFITNVSARQLAVKI